MGSFDKTESLKSTKLCFVALGPLVYYGCNTDIYYESVIHISDGTQCTYIYESK